MALPGPGVPMTAAMINVELGRASSAPFNINGAEERALAGIASGTISFNDFYGKSAGPTITISNQTFNALNLMGNAISGALFGSGGVLFERRQTFTFPKSGEWIDPSGFGVGADYDIFAQLLSSSGTNSVSGTFNSWLRLNVNREWTITRSVVGFATRTIRFSIRPFGGGTTLATGDITLQAERA